MNKNKLVSGTIGIGPIYIRKKYEVEIVNKGKLQGLYIWYLDYYKMILFYFIY